MKEFNRSDRVGQRIQRELASLIQYQIKDPRLPQFITIAAVNVSKDLSYAKVYITVLGDQDTIDLALDILKHAAGFLRSELAKKLSLRTTPQLRFIYDSSMDYGNRLAKLIDEVNPKDTQADDDDDQTSS